MAKDFTKEQQLMIGEALAVYGDELLKLVKKTTKLGLPEQSSIKQKYLGVQRLRDEVGEVRTPATPVRGDRG